MLVVVHRIIECWSSISWSNLLCSRMEIKTRAGDPPNPMQLVSGGTGARPPSPHHSNMHTHTHFLISKQRRAEKSSARLHHLSSLLWRLQTEEPGKTRAESGKRETFCSGLLEPSQGGKPAHEQWEANVCSTLLSGWADLRLGALAVLPILHLWWRVREEQGYGKRMDIALLFLQTHRNR